VNAINGGGVIAMSPKQYETIAGDIAINSSSTILGGYPSDQCFWFMEASHVNGTVILRTDYNFKLRDSITVNIQNLDYNFFVNNRTIIDLLHNN